MMGSAYEGYVVWKSGEATKYYAFDLDTTYRAVMQASDQLKLEATLIKSAPNEGYSLETKGNVPMHIDILPLEKSVTTVVIRIPTFGDKHYVELFYRLVDDNLPKKETVGKEKTQWRRMDVVHQFGRLDVPADLGITPGAEAWIA